MQLKLLNVPIEDWEIAANIAMQINHLVEKVGIRNGAGVLRNDKYFYLYKTKTQIVVRCK